MVSHTLKSTLPGANNALQRFPKRNIYQSMPQLANYEGDGKTTITMLDKELSKYILIESCNGRGFFLSNNSFAFGSIILFPNVIFQWKVKTIEDINRDSLTLFKLLEPKLDLLVIGIGEPRAWSHAAMTRMRKEVKASGVNAEIMATRDAVATYNFMLDDYRVVAGAFLPTVSKGEETLLKLKRNPRVASIDAS